MLTLQIEKEKACVRRREAEKAQLQETAAADARALQESVRKQVQQKEALAEQNRVGLFPGCILSPLPCPAVNKYRCNSSVDALREILDSAWSSAQFGAAYMCIE